MGYNTRYTLSVKNGDYETDYQKEIEELSGYEGSTFEEFIKWYDHEDHMREISKKYPEVLFILDGKGEDSEDLWRDYYKNGLKQSARAVISYEEFDHTKLK